MTIYSILSLTIAMFILVIIPGPGVFITVSKALMTGFKNTIPVIIGMIIGDLIFLLFAIYGLYIIAEKFDILLSVIRYLGAGYIIWLGIKLWRTHPTTADVIQSKIQSEKYSFLGGLSVTLGNPKVILFYLSLLPTFINLEHLSTFDVAILVFIVSSVLGSVMLFYAFMASQMKMLLKSENVQNKINKVAGIIMIGIGITLLAEN